MEKNRKLLREIKRAPSQTNSSQTANGVEHVSGAVQEGPGGPVLIPPAGSNLGPPPLPPPAHVPVGGGGASTAAAPGTEACFGDPEDDLKYKMEKALAEHKKMEGLL